MQLLCFGKNQEYRDFNTIIQYSFHLPEKDIYIFSIFKFIIEA